MEDPDRTGRLSIGPNFLRVTVPHPSPVMPQPLLRLLDLLDFLGLVPTAVTMAVRRGASTGACGS